MWDGRLGNWVPANSDSQGFSSDDSSKSEGGELWNNNVVREKYEMPTLSSVGAEEAEEVLRAQQRELERIQENSLDLNLLAELSVAEPIEPLDTHDFTSILARAIAISQ